MKTRSTTVWAASLLLAMVATGAWADGNFYYVSTNGNDTTGADWDNAFTEVQTALNEASDGDTIYVAGQTFELFAQSAPTWTNANLTMIGGFAATNATEKPGVSDPEQWPTVIEAGDLRTMWMRGADNATLQNVRLTGGAHNSGGNLRIDGNSTGVRIIGCVIDGNDRSGNSSGILSGGGIWIESGCSVTMIDCIVKNNYLHNRHDNGSARGGGIWNEGTLIIENSRILNNRATSATYGNSDGGGIFVDGGMLSMTNVLIAGNYANAGGSGLYIDGDSVSANFVTVADHPGDGIRLASGTLDITDSIVWGNWIDIDDQSGGGLTVSYSNVGDTDFGNNNLNTDPLLEYGYYLNTNSPCIGKGSAAADTLGMEPFTTRTDGQTYAPDQTVDMGYHHSTGFDLTYADIYVATDGDDGNSGTNVLQPVATLTHALSLARAGTRVHVTTGTFNVASGESFPLVIPPYAGIRIIGADRDATILDASGSGLVVSMLSAHRAVLKNLTVTGGGRTPAHHGAGLGIVQSQGVMLNHCMISDNSFSLSSSGATSLGGGINALRSDVTLSNCVITANSLSNTHTAGDSRGAAIWSDGTLTILNSKIRDNVGTSTCRGAVYFDGVTLVMRNVLMTGNDTDNGGDAIAVGLGTAIIENCTIADNQGEGVRGDGGDFSVLNSILWGNGIDSTGTVTIAYSIIENSTDYTDADNNLYANPLFVDAAGGNYRLQRGSPAIDTGLNQPWMVGATDLDGLPRILKGTVDRGCYEAIPPTGSLFFIR